MELLHTVLNCDGIEKTGWILVHFLWQGMLIGVLLAFVLRVLHTFSSRLRYGFACAALLLMAAAPFITLFVVGASKNSTAGKETVRLKKEKKYASEYAVASTDAPAVEPGRQAGALNTNVSLPAQDAGPVKPALSLHLLSEQIGLEIVPLLPFFVLSWIVGVLLLSVRNLGSWYQLKKLRNSMSALHHSALISRLKKAGEAMGINRAIPLLESKKLNTPVAIGWLHPVICLPACAVSGLRHRELEVLLVHELAHIRRYDYLLNLLQKVIETLGFYNPAVWWVSRTIRVERENCCDDAAIAFTGDRIQYARALTSMEAMRGRTLQLEMAASGSGLLDRINRIIFPVSSGKRFSFQSLVMAVSVLCLATITAAIAFTDAGDSEQTPERKKEQKKIVFMSERDGNSAVYIMNNDGSSQTLLSEKGKKAMWPKRSPDGKKIVYYSEQVGVDHLSINNLFIMKSDGSEKKLLRKKLQALPNSVCWSPDSTKIAVGNLILDLDGKVMRELKDIYMNYPTWSPDGTKIAFKFSYKHDSRSRARGLFVMNSDGSGCKRISELNVFGGIMSWSPDSKRIALACGSGIHIVDSENSDVINITNDDYSCIAPSWLPDGRTIVYASIIQTTEKAKSRKTADIFSVNTVTRKIKRITNRPHYILFPRVSHDGRQIAFRYSPGWDRGVAEVGVVNVDGTGFKILTRNKVFDGAPEWR